MKNVTEWQFSLLRFYRRPNFPGGFYLAICEFDRYAPRTFGWALMSLGCKGTKPGLHLQFGKTDYATTGD